MQFRTFNDVNFSFAQDLPQLNRHSQTITFPPTIQTPQNRPGANIECWPDSENFNAIRLDIMLPLLKRATDNDDLVTSARHCVRHFEGVSPDSTPSRFFGILLAYKTNAKSFSRSFSSCGETHRELFSIAVLTRLAARLWVDRSELLETRLEPPDCASRKSRRLRSARVCAAPEAKLRDRYSVLNTIFLLVATRWGGVA